MNEEQDKLRLPRKYIKLPATATIQHVANQWCSIDGMHSINDCNWIRKKGE